MFPRDCTEGGIYDMGGNVWEWCVDWRDVETDEGSIFYEKTDGAKDPVNDQSGAFGKVGEQDTRVVRGGSWGSSVDRDFRCAFRYWFFPDERIDFLGFRLVCSPA